MAIIVLFLFILLILCILFFLVVVLSPYYYYSVPLFIVSSIIYVIEFCLFLKYTSKYPKNSLSEFDHFKFKKAIQLCDGKKCIVFKNNHGIWSCECSDCNIKLDLRGYLFQRQYIRAYVIRNMRYKYISRKRPLKNLTKLRFAIGYKGNLFLKTIDKKIKICKIVDNGVSISTHFSSLLNRAGHYKVYLSNRTAYQFENSIESINERIYMNRKQY